MDKQFFYFIFKQCCRQVFIGRLRLGNPWDTDSCGSTFFRRLLIRILVPTFLLLDPGGGGGVPEAEKQLKAAEEEYPKAKMSLGELEKELAENEIHTKLEKELAVLNQQEEIFIKEAVAKKFNAETLRKLTGDDTIDFERFRIFYLNVNG